MRRQLLILVSLGIMLLFSACSTQRNTWLSRHYQELNTRYNVYFNGNEAYKQGFRSLESGFKEDYSTFLPLYEVSNHNSAKATASNMDKAIEKCQKAIKNHSIRVKPKKKPDKKSSELARRFYNQEEFNPFMDEVFMLMANAQFHKADFLSAASTCTYVTRHFSSDKKLCDRAGILQARAYLEQDWLYDAENILNNLNKENLTPSLTADFSGAYADLLLRREQYAESLPYLEIAAKKAKHKKTRQRWNFLLGQLYQETGKREKAYQVFNSIPKMNPPYEMELSARIRQTEVYPGSNPQKPLKKLIRMSGSNKNTDYLDQIYYALGNLYLAAKDTVKALDNYHQALLKSTQNGPHKLKTLLTLGSFYYKTQQFVLAEPCYSDAAVMLNKEDERFKEITQMAEKLKAVAPPLKTIFLEDSLQNVVRMSEEERNELIASMVKNAEKKAKEEARLKSAQEAASANEMAMNEKDQSNKKTTTIPEISTDKSWYFYNASTVAKGLKEFQKQWGKRELKDDWRRKNKSAVFENAQTAENNKKEPEDSTSENTPGYVPTDLSKGANDPCNPNYYLKNLPFTEEQIQASNDKIADALYASGIAFREQMENDPLALKYFQELESRFPQNKNLENAWYMMYLILMQQNKTAEADSIRLRQITNFPKGPYFDRLKNPLFIEKLKEMYRIQDTLYAQAYSYYIQQKTDSLFYIGNYVADNYPISPLRPQFAFLQAMESARTGQPEEFHRLLVYIQETYPTSDLIPVIKGMLVYWDQGLRPVASAGYTNLLTKRDTQPTDSMALQESLSKSFQFDPTEPHCLLIAYDTSSTNINRLQFDVALYNFTNFLVRDYELSFAQVNKMDVLLIRGFENAEDVVRYRSWINFQNQKPESKYSGLRFYLISESNLKLLEAGASPEKYLEFFTKNYAGIKPNP
jgi:tetratricopeptide (TPR) repeat protein